MHNSSSVAHVNEKFCRGCQACLDGCPFNALRPAGWKVTVDENSCRGCGVCVDYCPVRVISMIQK